MSWRDPKFQYFSAEQSRKPGYLARRFRHYQRVAKERAEAENRDELERISKVRPMTRKAGQ